MCLFGVREENTGRPHRSTRLTAPFHGSFMYNILELLVSRVGRLFSSFYLYLALAKISCFCKEISVIMMPEPKRRKLQPTQSQTTRNVDSTPASTKQVMPSNQSSAVVPDNGSEVLAKIQHAKNFAVAQAQQDGSTGNYRIFDSPYGNFLLPVIPTRAELGG